MNMSLLILGAGFILPPVNNMEKPSSNTALLLVK